MGNIVLLKDVHEYDRTTVGGKANNLGELFSLGIALPAGFLVLTTAYEHFVAANDLQARIERLAATVSPIQPTTAEQAASAIQALFEQGAIPSEIEAEVLNAYHLYDASAVAVRSSATAEDLPGASFAGLHDTYLSLTSVTEVLSALKSCWASLWSARALVYRVRQHIAHNTVRMAVIVQQMVEADAAGMLFTCNPVTGARDEMVLNASWGLGEAIVSGQVNPDTLILNQNGQVKHLEVAEKLLMTTPTTSGVVTQEVPDELQRQAVLSASQIARLFELGKTIEHHFSVPQDIEWAIAGDQVFVLQARPVTTRSAVQTVTVRQEELTIPGDDAWEQRARPEIRAYDLWTRTNMGENFLDPITPLSATLWPAFFMLGHLPSKVERAPDAPPLPMLGERFYGRMYVNEGAIIQEALKMGVPTSFIDSTWGSSGRGLRSSDQTIHFWRLLRRLLAISGETRKAAKERAKQRPEIPKQPEQKQPRRSPEQLFTQIDAWVEAFQNMDLSQLDDRALWDYMPLWIERGKALRSILLAAALAGIAFYFLERRVYKWTGQANQATVLVQALSGVYTAEVGSMFWHMARTLSETGLAKIVQEYPAEEALVLLREQAEAQPFLSEFETFLQRHGYRCPNDAELHNPRWSEQPAQVIEMLKSYLRVDERADPLASEQRRRQEREETTKRLRTQINLLRRPLFNWLLKQAQDKTRLRDNNRSYVAKFLFPMRLLLIELGQRWTTRGWLADPDDIFFLTLYEIDDIINAVYPFTLGTDLITTTAARRTAFDYWYTISTPAALGPGGLPLADPQLTGSYLQGLPASAGRIRGTARLVESISEASQLAPGEILVTRSTDPGWTPLFPLVGGLVLEVGGLLSHGAIIAREYGIPAVINLPGALSIIQDGQIIEVDGTNGRVYLAD